MKLLHETLTESVRTHADKIALVYKNESLTYLHLDKRSGTLASLCHKIGAGIGNRVGIYIDKSIDAIVGIFGVLKSGACYVPLDPLTPEARLDLIIRDCSLKYLVTESSKLEKIKNIAAQTSVLEYIIVLDIDRHECSSEIPGIDMFFRDDLYSFSKSTKCLSPHSTPDNLAYILYTSGSTGQPKGVMLSHKAALSFVDWACNTFSLNSSDIVSSHAPLHFDLSIFDIFVSIKAGATICIVPQGWAAFPRTIADFIEYNKISTWYSVPSALIQLVLHGKLKHRQLNALRQILFAGEVFPSKYLSQLMNLIPNAQYFNLYGPTETNVITYYHLKERPEIGSTIPIGSLCDEVQGYIVGESGEIVDKGDVGELYVECPTLMEGYWNDKNKTQGVLQINPFNPRSNNMLYKTGDLVHWDHNDVLVYHGRLDTMIKSRGYRIELGEIEAVLSAHPGLKEVAVTTVPDEKIGAQIKAMIVPSNSNQINEKEIKLFCAQKLPAFMIPEIIIETKSLPRTSTGKIDRKKIAHPVESDS